MRLFLSISLVVLSLLLLTYGNGRGYRSFRIKPLHVGILLLCFCWICFHFIGGGETDRTELVSRRIADLKEANKTVRYKAAIALGTIKDPRAVGPLIAALKDEDQEVRIQAASALGNIGDPRAVEPLIAALEDKDAFVRSVAAKALGMIGMPAVEPLLAALKSENGSVQGDAAKALGMIKDLRDVELLVASLKDVNRNVRRNAADALGMIRDPRAIEPLLFALQDESIEVRECAGRALGMIGAPAVEPLIAALRDANQDVRQNAALALGMIEDRRAASILQSAMKEADLVVIAGAYWFFIQQGEPGSENTLIQALNAHGKSEMAQAFLNCGNTELEAAGRKWATAQGYYTIPEIRHFQPGRWGGRR